MRKGGKRRGRRQAARGRDLPWGSTSFMIVFTWECDMCPRAARLSHPVPLFPPSPLASTFLRFYEPLCLLCRSGQTISDCLPEARTAHVLCAASKGSYQQVVDRSKITKPGLYAPCPRSVISPYSEQITSSGWEKHLSGCFSNGSVCVIYFATALI